jgi:ABC-type branched-subunit amino acid transport system substrate-binding protein
MKIIIKQLLETTRNYWLTTLDTAQTCLERRQFIVRSAHLAVAVPVVLSTIAWSSGSAQAQGSRNATSAKPITVAQIVDMSPAQQDVSKDFLIGSRAAWQDINARGGIRGRSVSHLAIETDGSAQSLQAAWAQVQNNPQCMVLSGCSADPLATQVNALMRNDKSGLANVAPWLQNSSVDMAPNTYGIFSTREEQIAYAIKSLSSLNVNSLAVVFASQEDRQQNLQDIQRIALKQNLQLQEIPLAASLLSLGQTLNSATAAVVLFVGGTPELAQFTQGMAKQARQRYIVALADVNLQVLQQMSGNRSTPVIATQAVPLTNAALPVVRNYRQVMAKLYDEPPVSLSLAGFIAARYTFEVIQNIEAPLTRSAVLEAFARRQNIDVGGFKVAYEAQHRATAYVTQSMLAPDGRIVG